MSIENECMVVNLRISVWAGHRLDKEWSHDVTREAEASEDAARVNKHLIPKESLKKVTQTATQVRSHFYKHTLPWKDNGDRLLTRKMMLPFMEQHSVLRDAFDTEVSEFLERGYPIAREQARFRMGSRFNPNDYPTESALRHKFGIDLDIDPVTTANDFRVELSAKHEKAIRENIESALQKRIAVAMGDVWGRINDAVSNFHDRMKGDTYFKNATIDNLREIVEILPSLNVIGDPDLDKLAKQVSVKLLRWNAEDLRENKDARSVAADAAKEILEDMAGFMNAFKGAA